MAYLSRPSRGNEFAAAGEDLRFPLVELAQHRHYGLGRHPLGHPGVQRRTKGDLDNASDPRSLAWPKQCWHEATLSSAASIPSSLPTTYADGYCRAAAVENTPARDAECYRVGGDPWAVCTRVHDCGEQGGDSAARGTTTVPVRKTLTFIMRYTRRDVGCRADLAALWGRY